MNSEEFLKLWDEILTQDNVEGIYIIAFRGYLPEAGPAELAYVGSATDPMEQLKETLAWLKANPFSPDKKRGRKKKAL